MITREDATTALSATPDGTCEADRAEQHAAELASLIHSGTLSPDGQAAAHGTLALASAVLALRKTITATSAGTAGMVCDMAETLEVIADVVTSGLDLPAVARAGGVL